MPEPEKSFVSELAAVYLSGATLKATTPEAELVWEAVENLMNVPRVGGWLVVALARHAHTPIQRSFLAAGPLEDLIERGGKENLAIIDSALATNRDLAVLLFSVNEPSTEPGFSWLRDKKRSFPIAES